MFTWGKCTDPVSCIWKAVIIAAAVIVLASGYLHFRSEAADMYERQHQSLSAVGQLKAGQIGEWRGERLADAKRAAASPFFRRGLSEWLAAPDDQDLVEAWRERLQLEQSSYEYDDVLLLGPDGGVLLSAAEAPGASGPATLHAVTEATATGRAVMSDIYLSTTGRVLIDTVAPVFDLDGSLLAVLVLRSDLDTDLFPLIQTWPTPSESSETLLVQRDGDEVLFLNELRHQSGTAMTLRISLDRTNVPAVQAVLGRQGVYEGVDYRGHDVLADLRAIPDTPWFMVAKQDTAEILADLHYHAWTMSVLAAVLVLLTAAVLAYLSRHRQAAIYRSLYESERAERKAQEEIRATLYSIGDGVITTDGEGRVRRMNPVAERLTGWTEADAQSQPLDDVFRIVNEDTRAAVENPVHRVLREGKVVGLANHTVLIAKDGIERPIADSGAPICDEGAVAGVVLVFRDQSEERAAENALRRTQEFVESTLNALSAHIAILDEDGTIVAVNRAWRAFAAANADSIAGLVEGANYLAVCEGAQGAHREGAAEFAAGIRAVLAHEVDEFVLEYPCHAPGEERWFVGKVTHFHTDEAPHLVISHENITARKQAEAALQHQRELLEEMERVAKIGGWEFDTATGTGKWTDEIARMQGIDPAADATVELGLSMFQGESRARIEAAVKEAVEHGTPYSLELEITTVSGATKWVHTIGHPHVEDGRVVRVRGSMQDITDRKRAEEALHESEEHFRKVVENAPDAIFVQTDGRFAYVNETCLRLLGAKQPSDLLAQPVLDRVHPASRKAVSERIRTLNDQRVAVGMLEEAMLRLNGEPVDVEVTAVPLMHRGRSGALVFVRDISDRKQAERALREVSEQLKGVLAHSPLPIGTFGLDGRCLVANPALGNLAGMTGTEVPGKTLRDVLPGETADLLLERIRAGCPKRRTAVYGGACGAWRGRARV